MAKRNRTSFNEVFSWFLGPACGCLMAILVLVAVFILGWWFG